MKKIVFITILSLLSVVTWTNAQANGANSNSVCYEPVSTGNYVSLVEIPDNSSRLLLADKTGKIVLVNKTSGEQIGTFVDISGIVLAGGQQGLLGLALHPDYTTNGKVYIYYTCNQQNCPINCTSNDTCDSGNCFNGYCTIKNTNEPINSISYIAELTASNNNNVTAANASTLINLVRIENSYATNQGGWIAFGNDTFLYAGIGDGGLDLNNATNNNNNNTNEVNQSAQDLTVLLGKIIRIDVNNNGQTTNYSIPTNNPFVNTANARPEIYAVGLRNPWRCSFDQPTNRLFCGDDGHGNQQEIDIITAGANYGWPRFDGNLLLNENQTTVGNNVTFPIITYSPTNNQPWGVIGGFVYRGTRDPCACGKYFYADTTLYQATQQSSGNWSSVQVNAQCNGTNCTDFNNVFSFGQDANSELYFLTDAGVFRFIEPSSCGFQCNCSCVINGVCLNANATNPNNTCQFCDPEYPCVWSTRDQCSPNNTTSTSSTSSYGSTSTGNVPQGTTESVVIPTHGNNSGVSTLVASVSMVIAALAALIF